MADRSEPAGGAGPPDDETTPVSGWRLALPAAFVLISLVTLFVVPLLIRSRVNALRDELELRVEPARDLVDELELSFAREGAAIRSYLLTQSPSTRALYRQVRAAEANQFARFAALRDWPGTPVDGTFRALRAEVDAWHAAHEALLAGRISPEAFTRRYPPDEPQYERILRTALRLDDQLAAYADTILARMEATERLGLVLTIGLALLALVSALAVVRIQRALRTLAARLRRRAREEEALRRAAASLGATDTIDAVLSRIASSAIEATDAAGAFVERVDPDRTRVEVVSAAGSHVPPPGTAVPYAGSFAEQVLRTGEPRRIQDLAGEPRPMPGRLPDACAECDAIVVPLVERGEAFGSLFIIRSPAQQPFDTDDVNRARIFGDLASLAFRRASILDASERSRRELQHVMESRARLVRGFSHDVKNPLGAADGYLELLELGVHGELPAPQREDIARSRRSIRAALKLIQELVDLARAEAGQLQLHRTAVDAASLVRSMVDEYRAQAESAGLKLTAEVEGAPPIVSCDPDRLRQILGNLISNAVKYTPAGGRVTARVRPCAPAPEAARPHGGAAEAGICIDVADTGPGIPPDEREAIFREFTRLAPGTARGAGLGLAISRSLARLMGGDVTVESRVGRGSTFTIRLPVAPVAGAAPEAAA